MEPHAARGNEEGLAGPLPAGEGLLEAMDEVPPGGSGRRVSRRKRAVSPGVVAGLNLGIIFPLDQGCRASRSSSSRHATGNTSSQASCACSMGRDILLMRGTCRSGEVKKNVTNPYRQNG